MSVQYRVICVDCRLTGPSLGDGGYWGAPSLEAGEAPFWDYRMPTFWHLYEPLSALGLRLYDFEVFREFLESHRQHRLLPVSDHDDPARMARAHRLVYEEIEEILEDPEFEETEERMYAEEKAAAKRRLASGEFVRARYVLSCQSCQATQPAPMAAIVKQFVRLPIAPETINQFQVRVADREPDLGWYHRVHPLVRPTGEFLQAVGGFFAAHESHAMEATLERIAEVPEAPRAG